MCNPTCDATHVCSAGHCLLMDAQQCVTGSQCASGACNPFYADVDGDGYGAGLAVGFCTLATPPIGYAAQNGDCCDDAPNIALAKLIHPGADFQATSAGGVCGGITWDYDCSGTVEAIPKRSCAIRTIRVALTRWWIMWKALVVGRRQAAVASLRGRAARWFAPATKERSVANEEKIGAS